MGCANGKPSSSSERVQRTRQNVRCSVKERPAGTRKPMEERRPSNVGRIGLEKKIVVIENVNDGGRGGGGRERERERERDRERVLRETTGNANTPMTIARKKIEGDEFVGGFPKWLVDNVSKDILAGLVPKSADSYVKLAKVGHGTYSNVYKARDRDSGKIVALKKVRFDTSESESIKFMAREIMMLKKLDHPNIIKLKGLATSRLQYSLYLVFDYMRSDLMRIISRSNERLNEAQIKCYMHQLLSGLQHCHERGILHRDIKASNLLIDKRGMLKIADFGLANFFGLKPKQPLTRRVVTLWYRSPELLLGSTDYGVGIDLWSAGCLLAEMFVGRPIMPGRTEVEQLHKIFKLCGTPSEDYWKIMKLPVSFRPPHHYKPSYEEAFKDFPQSSLGLLTTLLDLDPERRGTAASALKSEFFRSSPLACDISELPVVGKDEDEKRRSHKKHRKKEQLSNANAEDHPRQDKKSGQVMRDSKSSKEEKNIEPNLNSQEMLPSTSSGSKLYMNSQEGISQTFLPLTHSMQKISPRTEGHPNALKNIKDYTLLQAGSIWDIVSHNQGNEFAEYRRSISTLDFRSFDPENLAKILAPLEKG